MNPTIVNAPAAAAAARGGHAAHRPPGPPPTLFGNVYPVGDIVTVVYDRSGADALVAALEEAGFPDTDLDILEPEMVMAADETLRKRRTLLNRLGSLFGDEGHLADSCLELVRNGHPVVLVHAPTDAKIGRARPILARHKVLMARHYGTFAVTDL